MQLETIIAHEQKKATIKASTKNAIDKMAVIRLIHNSAPLSFLLAKSSDFSPVNACVASSLTAVIQ